MLRLQNICVKYSYKTVLTDISLTFENGKIYSLLGENGAGKSTLAHVICGDIQPTKGSLYLNEKELKIKKPKDAIKKGIVCVHQRPLLASSFSILDNLRIGIKHKMAAKIPELTETWIPGRSLSESVDNISEQELFNTSLTAALLKSPCLLILDEPPSLDLKKLRKLTEEGITIIIITHSFKEAIEKTDHAILLKDGRVLEQCSTKKLTEKTIKEKLFGLTQTIEQPSEIAFEDISETELIKIRLKERASHKTPLTGYIPSDRSFRASNPNLTILQLLTAYHTDYKNKDLIQFAEKLLSKAGVNIKLYEKASCLSGGMLQRLILEKELAENPQCIYLFNPTHGLDAEATELLYNRLRILSQRGIKVIIGNNR